MSEVAREALRWRVAIFLLDFVGCFRLKCELFLRNFLHGDFHIVGLYHVFFGTSLADSWPRESTMI